MIIVSLSFLTLNLFFWIFIFGSLSLYNEQKGKREQDDIEHGDILVAIAVRNEADNLRRNLPSILEQEGLDFRVLLIDDYSTDHTATAIEELAARYPNLVHFINKEHKGKKRSLHEQLMNVKADVLVFTDGDCSSTSPFWLRKMVEAKKDGKQIVLGYAPFTKEGGWLNRFARYECFLTAIQYLSYALKGLPYMGVGRNLVYDKKLFDQQNGFEKHLDLLSGDDDLFVNQASNAKNTTIQIDPASFIYSKAATDLKSFLHQKRRHISTAPKYKKIHQMLLGVFALSHFLFYVSLFFIDFRLGVLFWILRNILIMSVHYRTFKKLDAGDLWWYFPLLDILLNVYYVVLGILGIFPNRKKW